MLDLNRAAAGIGRVIDSEVSGLSRGRDFKDSSLSRSSLQSFAAGGVGNDRSNTG